MSQLDPKAFYPYITSILERAGVQVRLGGVVEGDQVIDSTETTTFTWDYSVTLPKMRQLYERGVNSQWKAADLPWETDVDLDGPVFEMDPAWVQADWYRRMDKKAQQRLNIEYNTNLISQFMHGEQGALQAAAQLINAVPDMDAKFYAASQAFDEGRHVEVFSRYIHEKLEREYPCTQNLFNLIQAITVENRWDFKFLGMQMVVEGLAISAFMSLLQRTHDPLFQQLIRLVLRDEARHVAFGVISLHDYYTQMNERERRERQEFVYEACILMRGRLISGDAYERMGVDPVTVKQTLAESEEYRTFIGLLFSQIVPNMKKIGLLEGWLAERFDEMGVLMFKDYDADAVLDSLIAGNAPPPPEIQAAG